MLVRFHWSTRSPHLLFTPFLLFFSNLIFNFTYMCSLERNTIYAPYLLIFRLSEENRSHSKHKPSLTAHSALFPTITADKVFQSELATAVLRTVILEHSDEQREKMLPNIWVQKKKKKLGNQKTDTGARVEQTKNKLN